MEADEVVALYFLDDSAARHIRSRSERVSADSVCFGMESR